MKLVYLILISGIIGLLLCACSASQIGNDEPFLQSSREMEVERISPENAGGVILLRNLVISAYQRGDLSQCSLDFSPDGQLLVGACGMNPVPVWDVDSGEVRYSLNKEDPVQIVACEFSPDGKSIACGGFDNLITLWNTQNGERINVLGPLRSSVWELAFSPDGQRIAAASFSNDIQLWDVKNGSLSWASTGIKAILSVDFHPSGGSIAYGTRMGTRAGILNSATGEVLTALSASTNNVGDIEVSPDGKWIAAGCDDNKVYLWNASEQQLIATLAGTCRLCQWGELQPGWNAAG